LIQSFSREGVGASRVHCPEGSWATVHDFLCERFTYLPREVWAQRFESGSVLTALGTALRLDAPYEARQTVHYFREVAHEPHLPYYAQVLYQDAHLVVADKPHFLPVIPSGQFVQETLLVRLKRELNLPDLVPLHRIDRDTAGLVMFAVKPCERAAYHALFREGKVHKTYQAIAPFSQALAREGFPLQISNRLETASNFMQMQAVAGEPNAHTQLLSMERLSESSPLARYTLQPLTGKRHQLRVHMLGLGVPIAGDGIYPEFLPERDIATIGHAPLQLLAQRLRFIDPITGEPRSFESLRSLTV
jgi:tRNA pseudouridine32 synthase / 23S rRNA pseudouridine746 synthase